MKEEKEASAIQVLNQIKGSEKMIELKIPATSANLGPGYDTLGLALKLSNDFKISKRKDKKLKIKIITQNNKEFNISNSDNLIAKAYQSYFKFIGQDLIGAEIIEKMNAPLARGLGSSASAIIGGLAAAALNSGYLISENDFIQLAVKLEKHPDNVIPALVGGLTINYNNNDNYNYYKINLEEKLNFVLVVPDFELKTENSRKVLPEKISYQRAVANLAKISLLTTAFINHDYQLLKNAMADQLHQPFRKKLILGFDEIIKTAYQNGALGAALSGAGPTILALAIESPDLIANKIEEVFNKNSINSKKYIVKACNQSLYQILKEEIS